MNDLIKEFARQSGFKVNWQHEDMQAIKMAQYKEFDEKIVRECINIVKPTSDHEAFAQNYLGGVDGLELLEGKIKNIKQHFGVRE